MTDFRADLHCHSTCSDGSLTPFELVHLAKQKGLSGLSITDHDTVEAYSEGIAALCMDLGIALITGVEFSAMLQDTSIHILGYGFRADDPAILAFCAKHAARRKERNKIILQLLDKHGMPVSESDLTAVLPDVQAKGRRSIGRPHIALAMVDKGYVGSVQEAFKKYIGEDKPCYAPGSPFSIEETIDIIHNSNGAAIIAHPHLLPHTKHLGPLLDMEFDGIECFYGTFPPKDHQRWVKIAQDKQWLVTGGSDFHGTIKPNINLGCSWIDQPTFQALKDFLMK
jgi:predicted metal-dependent phosphoesterase TrpH